MMKYLSEERGHNPASQSFTGRTVGWMPLHHAAVCNQLEMVKYLVDEQLVDPLCQAEDGSAPLSLHLACVGGNVEVVAYLVKEMSKYLPLKDIVNCKNNEGAALIHTAALCGHLKVVKYFTTEINCDPNVIVTGDCSNRSINCGGRIALHHAAQRGHLNMVKFLVEQQKCNPTHMDDNMVTPLHVAAQARHLDTVRYLAIEQHCDFSCANCSNDTPLHHAARCGHLQVVKFFVDAVQCLLQKPSMKCLHLINCLDVDLTAFANALTQLKDVKLVEFQIEFAEDDYISDEDTKALCSAIFSLPQLSQFSLTLFVSFSEYQLQIIYTSWKLKCAAQMKAFHLRIPGSIQDSSLHADLQSMATKAFFDVLES